MEDIAPELLESIRALFLDLLGDDTPGADTYAAAGDYAERVGDALATAFQRHLTGDVLPDGRMYWNIADRVVRPLLEEDWRLCTGAAAEVQRTLNKAAGIGLAAQIPEPDKGRIDGILNEICAAERYEDKAWMLGDPVRTFSRAAVDETLRRNAEFQSKVGLRPRIVRTAEHGCCAWCNKQAGTYDYPDVPDDVYKRHANCRCSVEYDPGGGKRQDVWTKRWTDGQDRDILEQRKRIGNTEAQGYVRPGVQRKMNSELPNGLPIKGEPGSVVDKIGESGTVMQRRVYGADGLAMIDYDTWDHGLPKAHPTGAHKHVFNHSKKNPHGEPLPLTEKELEENADIIKRGINYHDES